MSWKRSSRSSSVYAYILHTLWIKSSFSRIAFSNSLSTSCFFNRCLFIVSRKMKIFVTVCYKILFLQTALEPLTHGTGLQIQSQGNPADVGVTSLSQAPHQALVR